MALATAVEALAKIDPIEFIEGDLRHTKDRWAGQLFDLRPWQRKIVEKLFSVDRAGRRKFTEALIGMPRKNGKSELGAAIALYMLVADGVYGAEVYGAAGDKLQARLVFNVARKMVEFSPVLSNHLKIYRDTIVDPGTDSVYRVVSSEAPLQHGLNPSAVVFDELWTQPNRELWEALTTGSGVRHEPLVVGLTTAGFDEESLLYELYQRGLRGDDPRFYFYWIGLPSESKDDYRKPATWKKANPALGGPEPFLDSRHLEDQMRRHPEAVFRRLHLNQWTTSEEVWIHPEKWDACAGLPEIEDGDEVVLGVDAGIRHDSTAVIIGALKDGELHVECRTWNPEDEGDEVLELSKVEDYIRECARRYFVREVVYDPYFMARSAQMLDGEGIQMVEFPQNPARMGPASESLYRLVDEGRVRHGGDKRLRAHALAAVVKQEERGWRISKSRSKRKIDALVAMAMVADRLVSEDQGSPGVSVL
jgi:phage terminase large subunit-like protein